MHSVAAPLSTAELEAYSKCAQFYALVNYNSITDSTIKQAKRILRKKGDINYRIPLSTFTWSDEDLNGGTLLHIACHNSQSYEISEDLLNLGADFTKKSECGDTALHSAFKVCSSDKINSYKFSKYQDDSNIKLILSAHVKFGNSSNPCNKDGFSHFHIACMANNVKAVEFFLENGVDVNHAVDEKAKDYPGYVPLHFALECCSTETVQVLLKYGAESSVKNGYGMTPLHQLLNQRIDLLGSPNMLTKTREIRRTLEDHAEKTEKTILTLLGNDFLNKVDIVDETGLSSFHIACTMKDLSKVENLLEQVKHIDHCVNMNSPMFPGYSALHFAAHCNINAMKLLHERGASVDLKNAKGLTPLDICIRSSHLEDIHAAVLLKPEWAKIVFSNNGTSLVDFLSAMRDATQLRDFLENSVYEINMTLPNDSPLWPGCTPLHVAVAISKKYMEPQTNTYHTFLLEEASIFKQIKGLLNNGADVTVKDASGKTPLHHAFRDEKTNVSILLQAYHHSNENPVDEDNLSHLHIACVKYDDDLIRRLLSNDSVDVNVAYKGEKSVLEIKPGWTPLNCVRTSGGLQMLLQRGAREFSAGEDRYDANTLHSACEIGDKEAVQRLLELGVDVNSTVGAGCTPLHVAVKKESPEVVELLLQRGADLIAKDDKGHTPLFCAFGWCNYVSRDSVRAHYRSIVSILKQREESRRRIEKETGITILHITCHMLDVEEVKSQLDGGANVDARVHKHSKLWPGCTALHLLMGKVKGGFSEEKMSNNARAIIDLLLDNDADVALADGYLDNDTPVHISYKSKGKDSVSYTELLLKHHRDFRINPVNNDGLSFFHIAVMMGNVEVIQKFLDHGVNVDQPTDFFADDYDGCTPLHMAIKNVNTVSGMRIVDLLLSYGADVNLEDAWGNSALHRAVEAGALRLHLMEKLLGLGANINCEDINGMTPFESLLNSDDVSPEDIQFFLKRGCRVNVSNPSDDEGYLGRVLAKKNESYRDILYGELMKAPDVGTVNELGRTLIHNSVAARESAFSSEEYVALFDRFKGFGYDIDDQDHAGQTPLHLAAQFGNEQAIFALLNTGADMNIHNSKNESAFSYVLEPCLKCENHPQKIHYHWDIVKALIDQVLKLDFFELDVSQINYIDVNRSFIEFSPKDTDISAGFYTELVESEDFTMSPLSLTAHDFLSDTNAVMKYSRMSESSRDVVDKVFESIDTHFKELLPILKLQYRKAVTRFQLVEQLCSLKALIGFPLPALCADLIFSLLTITDLKNVVTAIQLDN